MLNQFSISARRIILLAFDILSYAFISLAYFIGTDLLSDNFVYPDRNFVISSVILLAFIYLFRIAFGTDFNVWRYSNTSAYLSIVLSSFLAFAFAMPTALLFGVASSWWHLGTVAALFALFNLTTRFVYAIIHKKRNLPSKKNKISVAIVGAGQLGSLLANELRVAANSHYHPICFVDRDAAKRGMKVAGLPVYYENEAVIDLLKNKLPIQEIFIAIAGLDSEQATQKFQFYSRTGCKIKLYDTPVHEIHDHVTSTTRRSIREFEIEDLLFRKALDVVDAEAFSFYAGKTVLVTGGGGSIGSEICRQVAKCSPKKLIILDIYENNAYDIQQELARTYGDSLDLTVEIASVRDTVRLDCIFAKYRPEIVFHAAAHKHVPLMEHSNSEAVKNNVFGTYNTANSAEKYGVKKFILISTDKAVNPTNVMGASKRMCEMVIQCRTDSATDFAAVRFGNVLGSNGSVIPLFKKQIQNGGPITITDKRIIRYFMTIPEASQLVMQAGAMARKGELFVLDMGKPVKIYDLAENMIRLSGLTPNVDIVIEEVGLRPGEKLYEELLIKTEELDKTENKMIFIEKDAPLTRGEVDAKLQILSDALKANENEIASPAVKDALKRVVPTYHDPEEVNSVAADAEEMKAVL